jgi:DMSO/TMAO reductase YedYZ molybdopterin-dependent catalytic subunit
MASTKSSSRNSRIEIAVLALIVVTIFAVFVYLQPKSLGYAEVTDYQGQKLSSINEIQDNAIAGTQYIDVRNYTLAVDGLVIDPKNYTYDQVLGHQKYQKVVTLYCVEGWNAKILWEGVLLGNLFNETGIDPRANTVIFHAQDGYTTSLPLDYVINNNILLAYKMNGVVIPPQKGFPFQVVAESKYGYKWAKWITRIELSDNSNYSGFWESNGYSNSADV